MKTGNSKAERSERTLGAGGARREESAGERKARVAEQSAERAGKAADEARKAADEAAKAEARARGAKSEPERRQAVTQARQAAARAEAKELEARQAAQTARQLARELAREISPNSQEARRAEAAAQKAEVSARQAAQASNQAELLAQSAVQSDGFHPPNPLQEQAVQGAQAAAQASQVQGPPTPAQAAQQLQAEARNATTEALKADQRVQAAQGRVLNAQRALSVAQTDYENNAFNPLGAGQRMNTLSAARRELAAARQELREAQAQATTTQTRATETAGKADRLADSLEAQARQKPDDANLRAAATTARQAEATAQGAAAVASSATAPKPIGTVSHDFQTNDRDNGGQHDAVYDGAVVGGNGTVYPPGTDAAQIRGTLPDNGTAPTGERIYYVNGIQNDAATQSGSLQAIANDTGAEVIGIHNTTNGTEGNLVFDLVQCAMDKTPGFKNANAATRALASQIITDIQNGRPIHLMAHSQGGLVTSNALGLVKDYLENQMPGNKAQADAILKNIKVETFGSAAGSWPHGPQYVHYINDRDLVPMTTGLGNARTPSELQQRAGGDRAQVHFIHEDPRSANPLSQNVYGQGLEGIPAHDFNDGYLHHHKPFEEGFANSDHLYGASPVAVRDTEGNFQNYTTY